MQPLHDSAGQCHLWGGSMLPTAVGGAGYRDAGHVPKGYRMGGSKSLSIHLHALVPSSFLLLLVRHLLLVAMHLFLVAMCKQSP